MPLILLHMMTRAKERKRRRRNQKNVYDGLKILRFARLQNWNVACRCVTIRNRERVLRRWCRKIACSERNKRQREAVL